MNLAIWTMGAQVIYLWFSTLGPSVCDRLSWNLDLLDLRPLAPAEREWTTSVLVGVVMISLASLLMLDLIPFDCGPYRNSAPLLGVDRPNGDPADARGSAQSRESSRRSSSA